MWGAVTKAGSFLLKFVSKPGGASTVTKMTRTAEGVVKTTAPAGRVFSLKRSFLSLLGVGTAGAAVTPNRPEPGFLERTGNALSNLLNPNGSGKDGEGIMAGIQSYFENNVGIGSVVIGALLATAGAFAGGGLAAIGLGLVGALVGQPILKGIMGGAGTDSGANTETTAAPTPNNQQQTEVANTPAEDMEIVAPSTPTINTTNKGTTPPQVGETSSGNQLPSKEADSRLR